jgi:hypothetical protein
MIDYRFATFGLIVAYGIFRAVSWVISSAIKLMFIAAFIAIGVLAMSSTVGLLHG